MYIEDLAKQRKTVAVAAEDMHNLGISQELREYDGRSWTVVQRSRDRSPMNWALNEKKLYIKDNRKPPKVSI